MIPVLLFSLLAQDPSWRKEVNLFWPQEKRDIGYRNIEKIFETRTIKAGPKPRLLEQGEPLVLTLDMDQYIRSQHAAGLVILHHGKVVLEKYARGYTAEGRWVSQSVAKSITSMLIGAAIQDGSIGSVDDPITRYLPEMKGSAYDGVTLRQVLTMTSGIKWNEDYTDPKSDVANYSTHDIVSYMSKLPREAPPGEKWLYKSGETNLIGAILSRATGKNLATYLSEKIWQPYGMQRDAVWQLNPASAEISGCCMAVSLRDYARFGQFVLDGGKANGKQVVDRAYLKMATTSQTSIGIPGRGYGFQWWTFDDGSFFAIGIFGQSIFIDPLRHIVIATSGNWPTALDRAVLQPARFDFFRAVQSALRPSN